MFRTFAQIIFFVFFCLSYAQFTIHGKVFSASNKEPLPFVPVMIKGTGAGTQTDVDGNFIIKTNTLGDSLIAQYIGYKRTARPIKKGVSQQEINLAMEEDSGIQLEEVTVVMGENPAHRIIRNANKFRDKNNRDNLTAYQYETYNKIQFDLNKIPKEMREKKILKPVAFVFDNVDSVNSGEKPSLPFFLIENISEVYYRSNPKSKKEIVKATKITGMENASVSQLLGDMYQNINLYDNNIILFNKQIPSPIGEQAFFYYKFFLEDSAFQDGHYVYHIRFKPKRVQELTFTGNMWIADTTWGIKKIEMSLPKDANINFIRTANVVQEYVFVDSIWMLKKDRLVADIAPTKNSIGFYGRKSTSYKNFVINKPHENKFYGTGNQIVFNDSITKKDESYWAEHRHDSLTQRELKIFKMVDTIQSLPIYQTWVDIFYLIVAGYKKYNNFEIGPYSSLISYNRVEGLRLRFGGRTSELFSKWYELNGYVAYGIKDEAWKYSIGFKTFVTKKPYRQIFGLNYKSDYEILGQSVNGFSQDNFLASFLRVNPLTNLTRVDQTEGYFEREWMPGIISRFSMVGRKLSPLGTNRYSVYKPNGDIKDIDAIYNTEARINLRFAWGERYVGDGFTRVYVSSTWPVVQFFYSKSLRNAFKGLYDYHKVSLRISDRIRITPILGYTDYLLEGGKIWGTVPYPLMELHGGNETLIYDEMAYNMMNYYEFASDRYVSLGIFHHFDGLFFNKIPLIRKLKLREVATFKTVWGGVSDKNRRALVFPDNLKTLERMPYMECSVGVENILKVFRIDALWRLNYRFERAIDNFGIKFTFQFLL